MMLQMNHKVEGILINKTPYRDRDLVAKILLRSGKKISVLFYGGMGGGKKVKPGILELGHMFQIELKTSKEGQDLYVAKEWTALWTASSIRFDHRAFYLLCMMVELTSKLALDDNLHDPHQSFDRESEGIFKVLSNGLFYLDQAVKEKHFKLGQHLPLFLAKNMLEQGIFPAIEECISCGISLDSNTPSLLSPEIGGFQCFNCFLLANNLKIEVPENEHNELYRFFALVPHTPYRDYQRIDELNAVQTLSIFKFFCYQFHWQLKDFLSYPYLF